MTNHAHRSSTPSLDNPTWLLHVAHRHTLADIAKQAADTTANTEDALSWFGLVARDQPCTHPQQLHDADWLLTHHLDQGLSTFTLGARIGCSWHLVRNRLDTLAATPPDDAIHPKLLRPNWLTEQLHTHQRPLTCIADELGVATIAVADVIQRTNLPDPPERAAHHLLTDHSWMYRHRKLTPRQLARTLNAHPQQVITYRRSFGGAIGRSTNQPRSQLDAAPPYQPQPHNTPQPIAHLPPPTSTNRTSNDITPTLLARALVTHGHVADAAAAVGLDERRAWELVEKHQLEPPASHILTHDPDWLRAHYIDKKLSQQAIATMLNCSRSGVQHALRRHNLQRT